MHVPPGLHVVLDTSNERVKEGTAAFHSIGVAVEAAVLVVALAAAKGLPSSLLAAAAAVVVRRAARSDGL